MKYFLHKNHQDFNFIPVELQKHTKDHLETIMYPEYVLNTIGDESFVCNTPIFLEKGEKVKEHTHFSRKSLQN